MMKIKMADRHHKIVMLGETGVGKSSITTRFTIDQFSEDSQSTIGATFMTKSVSAHGRALKLDIWDTAGQERYRSMVPLYYRTAGAAVIVYDITSRPSLESAKSWVSELLSKSEVYVLVLVGNKLDLQNERVVSREEAEAYAKDKSMLFFEVSAKKDINVSSVFQRIAEELRESSSRVPMEVIEFGELSEERCTFCRMF